MSEVEGERTLEDIYPGRVWDVFMKCFQNGFCRTNGLLTTDLEMNNFPWLRFFLCM